MRGLVLLLLGASFTAFAQQTAPPLDAEVKTGMRMMETTPADPAGALPLFQAAAKAGNHEGEFQLAALYAQGLAVPKDEVQAAHYFQLSAEGGFAPAQFDLGVRYAYARGVPQDNSKAFHWFEAAAKQEYVPAELAVAAGYSSGSGVPVSERMALEWDLKAAAQGSRDGKLAAGLTLLEGKPGVPRDAARAVKLLRPVAEMGHPIAAFAMAAAYQDGAGVAQDKVAAYRWDLIARRQGVEDVSAQLKGLAASMTSTEVHQAEQEAAAWKPTDETKQP